MKALGNPDLDQSFTIQEILEVGEADDVLWLASILSEFGKTADIDEALEGFSAACDAQESKDTLEGTEGLKAPQRALRASRRAAKTESHKAMLKEALG